MAAGFGLLRLSPAEFWSLTPRELDAALSAILGPAAGGPPTRGDLAGLLERYPDFPSPPASSGRGRGSG